MSIPAHSSPTNTELPVSESPDLSELPAPDTVLQDTTAHLPGADIWLHTPQQPKRFFLNRLIWLTTLFSLGLHGLLLLLPVESEKPPAPKADERNVRITQLPTQAKPIARSSPTARRSPPPTQPRRPIRRTNAVPIPAAKPSPVAQPAAQPTPTTQPSPTPDAAPVAGNPWQDFPQYPGAQPGCYNLPSCLQTGKGLEEVSSYFQRELASNRYTAQLTINEPNRRVYQVSRDRLTQFLSLIQVDGKGTLYVLSEAPRTLADLTQAIEVPAAIYDVLAGLAAEDATRANFAQPDPFFSGETPHDQIGVMKLVLDESPDTFFDSYFRTNLFNSGFTSSETPQQYGGGPLYTVTKDDLSLYVNLVPTQDGSGTIVVIWKSQPE